MPLADWEIKKLVSSHGLIKNFREENLNSHGYDLTLAEDFLYIPKPGWYIKDPLVVLDPLNLDTSLFKKYSSEYYILPPGHFVLGRSVETIRMTRQLSGICLGRSSYARCGILVNITPLEAGWVGTVTVEISNIGPIPVKVHSNKGIAQILFFENSSPTRDYVQKGGRYQHQEEVTLSKGL